METKSTMYTYFKVGVFKMKTKHGRKLFPSALLFGRQVTSTAGSAGSIQERAHKERSTTPSELS